MSPPSRRLSFSWHAQRLALQVFRRLPVSARRMVVRILNPTFTAGSIVAIEGEGDAVLLIQQSYRRGWGVPGGMLGKGESPAEAAVREVREEVGLDVELLGPPRLVMDLAPRRLDFVFRARVLGPVPHEVVPTSPELDRAGWFSRAALPVLQFETQVALDALARDDVLPFLSGRD